VLTFLRRLFGVPIRSVIFDVVVAGSLGLLALATAIGENVASGLLGIGMSLAVLLRRRFPLQVFGLVALLGLGQILIGDTAQAYDLAVMLAMYSVVKYSRWMRWAWLAAGVVVVGAIVESVANNAAGIGGRWPLAAILLVIGSAPFWLVGLVGRTRRLYVESLVDRAEAAERERDQRARLAVADERARIARELHDVVAHSLAVMIVQADGAGYAIESDPGLARDAVRTVASTGREALAEMRRLVSVLRNPEDGGPPAAAPSADCPPARRTVGLGQLTPILDRFRASGLAVDLAVTGTAAPLPAGVELAGYRIVQESLTNTLKHAGAGSTVAVSVSYLPDQQPAGRVTAVVIEVVDDGAGRSRFTAGRIPGGGHGLLGMRERVAVYGGEFAAGPRVGTGWQVRARIPVPVDDPPQLPSGPLTVEGSA
jgi:signal transduction histidine kinase